MSITDHDSAYQKHLARFRRIYASTPMEELKEAWNFAKDAYSAGSSTPEAVARCEVIQDLLEERGVV